MRTKLFIGKKLRALRVSRGWKLAVCADALGISVSYLSQIEGDQRPISSRVFLTVTETFGVSASSLDATDDRGQIADLREALLDAGPDGEKVPLSELRQAAAQAPSLVRRYLELHRAYRRLDERLNATEEAVSLDERAAASSKLPYEEVRDFFHFKDNYIHAVDVESEALAERVGQWGLGEVAFETHLRETFGIVVFRDAEANVMRRYDPVNCRVSLNPANTSQSRSFQLAYQVATLSLGNLIEEILSQANLRSPEATDVCRVGLGNYAAGALVMPYRRFAAAARAARHDVEKLALQFDVSMEQVCHRLSTLQRPGERGLPFYFVRTDYAGNITKRHSATRLRFARFGGSCPLWNIHEAVGAPDRFLVQLAEMPDGVRYLCVARSVVKRSGAYSIPDRRYVLGFGCEAIHARDLVYADGLDLSAQPARIGVSCRICERDDCSQRAFPPVDRRLSVPRNERAIVPFNL
jgi:predicted transcriptional regulator